VKEKNRKRLIADFKRYTKQIGRTKQEKLKLVLDRKEMHKILEKNGLSKRAAGYGECFWDIRTIFVDSNIRVARYKKYPMFIVETINGKRVGTPTKQPEKKKVTYRDIRHTLIHELVHYRFRGLRHGKKFEQRIKEILVGRVFPTKNIEARDNKTNTEDNKNIPTIVEEMSPDEYNRRLIDDLVKRVLS
jgi:hypothetical protein